MKEEQKKNTDGTNVFTLAQWVKTIKEFRLASGLSSKTIYTGYVTYRVFRRFEKKSLSKQQRCSEY